MATNASATCIGNVEGFDEFLGRRWIYPNNLPIRGYQKAAVEKALFTNAMIVLPTGFGKTFIAAVVMYNFHRWYPQGKIIFVAPTKPLVAQQIAECKKISGIPASDCVEMTGSIAKSKRVTIWKEKRVFFATPQVIQNDLEADCLPSDKVKCLVIDEAHRAQGDYAYVQIVKCLQERNKNGFRILALSATPGTDIQKVQQVMLNLYIGDVMFRTENDIDLMMYKNEKVAKAWTVELVGRHREIVDKFIKLSKPIFAEIHRAGLTWSRDSIENVTVFHLLMVRNKLQANDPEYCHNRNKGRLKYVVGVAISLRMQFDLLVFYGLRVFYSSIMKKLIEPRSNVKTALAASVDLELIFEHIRKMFPDYLEPDISKKPNDKVDLLQGHPKLRVVKDLLFKHFKEMEGKKETRAIVFSKYRESVFDIVQTLMAFDEIIKPAAFVGQGNDKKSVAGNLTQKEQIQMVNDFKAGKYNVLVATCVAEEGLDIGEVDLIICYDTSGSLISNTQRRGRTGRKRSGNVQTLLTKDYEEKKLKKAGDSRRMVESQLFKRENYNDHRYREAPRLVPRHIIPICLEQKLIPVNDVVEDDTPKRKRRKKETTVEVTLTKSKDKGKDECEDKEQKSTTDDNENILAQDWDSNDCY